MTVSMWDLTMSSLHISDWDEKHRQMTHSSQISGSVLAARKDMCSTASRLNSTSWSAVCINMLVRVRAPALCNSAKGV